MDWSKQELRPARAIPPLERIGQETVAPHHLPARLLAAPALHREALPSDVGRVVECDLLSWFDPAECDYLGPSHYDAVRLARVVQEPASRFLLRDDISVVVDLEAIPPQVPRDILYPLLAAYLLPHNPT